GGRWWLLSRRRRGEQPQEAPGPAQGAESAHEIPPEFHKRGRTTCLGGCCRTPERSLPLDVPIQTAAILTSPPDRAEANSPAGPPALLPTAIQWEQQCLAPHR